MRTRYRNIGTDKENINKYPKQTPKFNEMGLGFLNYSNDIIYGDLDEILPDHNEVSGYIEPENKINVSDMEISEDADKDTVEDGKKSYDAWSEFRSMKVLIMMNHNLSKLYHQKNK